MFFYLIDVFFFFNRLVIILGDTDNIIINKITISRLFETIGIFTQKIASHNG